MAAAREETAEDLLDEMHDMLAEMKARGAGYVEVTVAVVHAVKAPQQRDGVVGAVPEIGNQIQADDGRRHAEPLGHR